VKQELHSRQELDDPGFLTFSHDQTGISEHAQLT
jgi:hypothetical protein